MLPKYARQISDNAALGAQLSQLEHCSPNVQLSAERVEHLDFTAIFDYCVEIIRTYNAASKKLSDLRHHARILRRTLGERQNPNQLSAVARGDNCEVPPIG